jgi:hypothetical protein
MVRATESKMLRYGSKVIIHIPMKMARDSAFPFLKKDNEDIIIEIKGKTLLIKKAKGG